MTTIIDGHIDLAFESLSEKRDYTHSVSEIRHSEPDNLDNQATVGWPELQKGQIGIIFSTIFLLPPDQQTGEVIIGTSYRSADECHASVSAQLDFYHRWQDQHPDMFRIILNQSDLKKHIEQWEKQPVQFPNQTNPVGLIILWEGAEGLRSFQDLDEYYERGMRIIGPVWGGGRWCGCGSDLKEISFTPEGRELMQVMAEKGFALDIAHMNTRSANEALDRYEGVILASHCNCSALLKDFPTERHLSDETIAHLIERDSVMGVLPFNGFLDTYWKSGDQRSKVTLATLANHIDHICQIAGDSKHAAIGSDSDGGFGFPNIPEEMNDIQDLQKIETILLNRGYAPEDVLNIFNRNWLRLLERILK